MRTWSIMLLALLLPLRLMASDAMAVHMMAGGVAQEASVTAASAHGDMSMHADCLGDTADSGDTDDGAVQSQNSHCPTCSHCQACSAVALAMHAETPLMMLAASGPPPMQATGFTSAEISPGQKPPIS